MVLVELKLYTLGNLITFFCTIWLPEQLFFTYLHVKYSSFLTVTLKSIRESDRETQQIRLIRMSVCKLTFILMPVSVKDLMENSEILSLSLLRDPLLVPI